MFEIVGACASTNQSNLSSVEVVAVWFLWAVLVFASIAAIFTAVRRKHFSSTPSADLMLSVFSPIIYWILFAFGAVSSHTPTPHVAAK